jgi:hypothetical protein
MKFGETLLEFSKETFFHNVLDGLFFCTAFTRGVFTNVPVKQHLPWPVLKRFNLHQIFLHRSNPGTCFVVSLIKLLLNICTVGGQIKLGHVKFNLCKSDYSIVNIFVSVYIICHTKVNLFVIKP